MRLRGMTGPGMRVAGGTQARTLMLGFRAMTGPGVCGVGGAPVRDGIGAARMFRGMTSPDVLVAGGTPVRILAVLFRPTTGPGMPVADSGTVRRSRGRNPGGTKTSCASMTWPDAPGGRASSPTITGP